jgi:hypothetical protein
MIVAAVAEAHGEVSARFELWKGSTFQITLRLAS